MAPTSPTVWDTASLAADAVADIFLPMAEDTHTAIRERVHSVVNPATGGAGVVPGVAHSAIAAGVYGSIRLGFKGAARAADLVARTEVGPSMDDSPRGRFVASAVNGLIGDHLLAERPQCAIGMAPRVGGRDVLLDPDSLARAYPEATGSLAVFMHGLCETESYWNRGRKAGLTTYPERLAEAGWTPVMLRANTGLSLRANGVALSALLTELVANWPVGVTRITLLGHSMGGLIIRTAGAVVDIEPDELDEGAGSWRDLVTDVIALGTPHTGSPVAVGVAGGARLLKKLPETAAFGRFLDWRSVGVEDLIEGLRELTPGLENARFHCVTASLGPSEKHLLGRFAGDLLVRVPSARGNDPAGRRVIGDGEFIYLPHTDHFGLLNHPEVHRVLAEWLGAADPAGDDPRADPRADGDQIGPRRLLSANTPATGWNEES